MITRKNFKNLIDSLESGEVKEVMESDGDYINMELSSNGVLFFDSMPYDPLVEQTAHGVGGIFCDKDQFAELLKEINYEY